MRPKSAIWDQFIKDSSNPINIKAKCKKCGTIIPGYKKRLEHHLKSVCRRGSYNSDDDDDDVQITKEDLSRKRKSTPMDFVDNESTTDDLNQSTCSLTLSKISSAIQLSDSILSESNCSTPFPRSSSICPPSLPGPSTRLFDSPTPDIRFDTICPLQLPSVANMTFCEETPPNLKRARPNALSNLLPQSPSSSPSEPPTSNNKKRKPSRLLGFCVSTSQELQYKLDLQAVRFIASSSSPFNLIEDPQFIRLWELLRPGSAPPNRIKLGSVLLDEVYKEQLQLVSQTTEGCRATVAIDGWSSITNTPVLGVAFSVPSEKSFFSHAFDTLGEPHDAAHLLKWAKEAIKRVEEVFKVRVVAVVTDGAPNMACMREGLERENTEIKRIQTYRCQAHLINLIAKEIEKLFHPTISALVLYPK
jgi:hypothetical protein